MEVVISRVRLIVRCYGRFVDYEDVGIVMSAIDGRMEVVCPIRLDLFEDGCVQVLRVSDVDGVSIEWSLVVDV